MCGCVCAHFEFLVGVGRCVRRTIGARPFLHLCCWSVQRTLGAGDDDDALQRKSASLLRILVMSLVAAGSGDALFVCGVRNIYGNIRQICCRKLLPTTACGNTVKVFYSPHEDQFLIRPFPSEALGIVMCI